MNSMRNFISDIVRVIFKAFSLFGMTGWLTIAYNGINQVSLEKLMNIWLLLLQTLQISIIKEAAVTFEKGINHSFGMEMEKMVAVLVEQWLEFHFN